MKTLFYISSIIIFMMCSCSPYNKVSGDNYMREQAQNVVKHNNKHRDANIKHATNVQNQKAKQLNELNAKTKEVKPKNNQQTAFKFY
jgi:hypothetical protein